LVPFLCLPFLLQAYRVIPSLSLFGPDRRLSLNLVFLLSHKKRLPISCGAIPSVLLLASFFPFQPAYQNPLLSFRSFLLFFGTVSIVTPTRTLPSPSHYVINLLFLVKTTPPDRFGNPVFPPWPPLLFFSSNVLGRKIFRFRNAPWTDGSPHEQVFDH